METSKIAWERVNKEFDAAQDEYMREPEECRNVYFVEDLTAFAYDLSDEDHIVMDARVYLLHRYIERARGFRFRISRLFEPHRRMETLLGGQDDD